MLAGIIRRHFEQGAAEFDAVADDEVEAVVGVASRDLVHLRQADIFGVSGLESESRAKLLQAVKANWPQPPSVITPESSNTTLVGCLPFAHAEGTADDKKSEPRVWLNARLDIPPMPCPREKP